MEYGILSLAPALVALILAFVTRDALFSIILGVLVGIIISGQNLLFGFTGILQSALGNADFIWVAAIEVFIGILVAFFMKSGAILSGGKILSKEVLSLRQPLWVYSSSSATISAPFS